MADDRRSAVAEQHQTCAHPDEAIAELAARQHGVVARRQLVAVGVTAQMLRSRIARRQLVPLHRGVYAAGHAKLRREGHWLAAVLAAGPDAALSHRDAAALHELGAANHQRIDVTTSRRGREERPGLTLHRSLLPAADVTTVGEIAVTSVARTLVDLAGILPAARLNRALAEAERRNLLDVGAVEEVAERMRTRRGAAHRVLRAALADAARDGLTLTRSELEERFLRLVHAHDLPPPAINAQVDGYEVDAWWRRQRLVVELDGYAYHHARTAFQSDRTKANALLLAGIRVLRFTHRDVVDRGSATAASIAAALTPRG